VGRGVRHRQACEEEGPLTVDPVVVLVAGPNGSGKTTLVTRVLQPLTHLPFVNADDIAAQRWPEAPVEHAYAAARQATRRRNLLIDESRSFITETVFSHPSKIDLIHQAHAHGFLVDLHVVLLPEAVAVARVAHRVAAGGHHVPEEKVRERYRRLWPLIRRACELAETTRFYDNSTAAHALRQVARFDHGQLIGTVDWPVWTPKVLTSG
jgi:predicted ABC-type ATPase